MPKPNKQKKPLGNVFPSFFTVKRNLSFGWFVGFELYFLIVIFESPEFLCYDKEWINMHQSAFQCCSACIKMTVPSDWHSHRYVGVCAQLGH